LFSLFYGFYAKKIIETPLPNGKTGSEGCATDYFSTKLTPPKRAPPVNQTISKMFKKRTCLFLNSAPLGFSHGYSS